MSAGPEPANKGPAGRGRGTALPAWMTSGVGQTSTSTIDADAPSIAAASAAKEPEKDLLADTFNERDVAAANEAVRKAGAQQKQFRGRRRGAPAAKKDGKKSWGSEGGQKKTGGSAAGNNAGGQKKRGWKKW